MTHDQIGASWATRGPLARAAFFRINENVGTLDLIADSAGPGRLLRAFRSLPLDSPDADIEAALSGLYVDLGGVERAADQIKARSFSEHLSQP